MTKSFKLVKWHIGEERYQYWYQSLELHLIVKLQHDITFRKAKIQVRIDLSDVLYYIIICCIL